VHRLRAVGAEIGRVADDNQPAADRQMSQDRVEDPATNAVHREVDTARVLAREHIRKVFGAAIEWPVAAE
jgi:hypothetical protein